MIDTESHEVTYNNKKVVLNPKEYDLLTLFLQYPHHILTTDIIIANLWTSDRIPTESTVRSHIKALRQSLKKCSANSDLIQNLHGLGYRLNPAYDDSKENIQTKRFSSISILKKFLHAKAIEYLTVDQDYTVKFLSPKISTYCDYPDNLKIGSFLGDIFPEFIGLEKELEKVRNKEKEFFTLEGIARSINPQQPKYINFYVFNNNLNNSTLSKEQLLLILVEDDSEKMGFRRQLVQQANEKTLLNLEAKK